MSLNEAAELRKKGFLGAGVQLIWAERQRTHRRQRREAMTSLVHEAAGVPGKRGGGHMAILEPISVARGLRGDQPA